MTQSAEPAQSVSRIDGNENSQPATAQSDASKEAASKRRKHSSSKQAKRNPLRDLLGRDVLLDGSLFSMPGHTYAARVMRKDPTHRGAVILRFNSDDSRIWLPADEVRRLMVEEEPCSPDEDGRADTLAAEVLVSLSGRSSADEYSQKRAERRDGQSHTAQSPLAGCKRPADG